MIIGLVGGIGSGKSTVLNYIKRVYDAEIIQADTVAKELIKGNNEILEKVKEEFPQVIENKKINSDKLAEIVFANEEKLHILNSITHPITIKEIINRITISNNSLIIVESALLLETEIEKLCNEIWYIFCEKEIRISRLISDRNYSKEKAESIISNQPDEEEYNKKADEFIDNSKTTLETEEQIDYILQSVNF